MRTRAIIHLDRFAENIKTVQTRIGQKRRICVTVKADAYGHGALEIAKTSLEAGVFCLGVATVEEGAELRRGGIKAPVLLLSQSHPDEIPELIRSNLIPFISDAEFASILNKHAADERIRQSVHMKIDTGMGRVGCPAEEAIPLARYIASCPALELTGTATHFAVSDCPGSRDIDYTGEQLSLFRKTVDGIRDAGIGPGIIHAANSGAVVLHPDSWLDMVRPGILLYGYNCAGGNEVKALPVMELRTTVVMIKKLKKGESVSYGRTWTAGQDTHIALLSIGYADGLPRSAGGKWQAVIRGKSYPLAGRITMDQCMADIGPQPEVRRWDEAVIFGGAAPDAAALAQAIGTIPYEITCNINKRVPREYTGKKYRRNTDGLG